MINIRASKLFLLCLALVLCLATATQDAALTAKNPSLRRLQVIEGAAVATATGVATAAGTGATAGTGVAAAAATQPVAVTGATSTTSTAATGGLRSAVKAKIHKAWTKFWSWAKNLWATTKPTTNNGNAAKTTVDADSSDDIEKLLKSSGFDSDDSSDDFQDAQSEPTDDFHDVQTEFGTSQ